MRILKSKIGSLILLMVIREVAYYARREEKLGSVRPVAVLADAYGRVTGNMLRAGWREGQFRPCDQYGEVLGIIDDSDVSYNDTCDDCMELLDPSGQARWEQAFIDDARRDGLREIPFTVPMELEGYGEESWEHLHNAWMEGLEEDMSTDYGMHLWSVARGYTTHA